MEAGKAMANTAEIAAGPRVRPGPSGAIGAIRRLDGVVLARSVVMHETLGGRTWVGVLANIAEVPCVEAAVRIRFLDREDRPVGAPVSARAARLAPGAAIHLRARLPATASGLRIESLRWTVGGRTIEPGPFAPQAFAFSRD